MGMARAGRHKLELALTEDGRAQLMSWSWRVTTALPLRSRIVLGCAAGLDNKQVAVRERVRQAAGDKPGGAAVRGVRRVECGNALARQEDRTSLRDAAVAGSAAKGSNAWSPLPSRSRHETPKARTINGQRVTTDIEVPVPPSG